jgi:hypothetical protein
VKQSSSQQQPGSTEPACLCWWPCCCFSFCSIQTPNHIHMAFPPHLILSGKPSQTHPEVLFTNLLGATNLIKLTSNQYTGFFPLWCWVSNPGPFFPMSGKPSTTGLHPQSPRLIFNPPQHSNSTHNKHLLLVQTQSRVFMELKETTNHVISINTLITQKA